MLRSAAQPALPSHRLSHAFGPSTDARRATSRPTGWTALPIDRSGVIGFGTFAVGFGDLRDGLLPALPLEGDINIPREPIVVLYCPEPARLVICGRVAALTAGDMICLDPSKPVKIECGGLSVVFWVSRSLLRVPPTALEVTHGGRLDGATGLGNLVSTQLAAIAAVAPLIDRAQSCVLTELVGELTTILFGAAVSQAAAWTDDLQLDGVLAFIERNLARPDLSPAVLCREFDLSRSALYRLFEPLGGIASVIRQRRLECARRQLAISRHSRGTVARIARSVGFPSDAAFTRAYRRCYGMVPRAVLGEGLRKDAQLQSR